MKRRHYRLLQHSFFWDFSLYIIHSLCASPFLSCSSLAGEHFYFIFCLSPFPSFHLGPHTDTEFLDPLDLVGKVKKLHVAVLLCTTTTYLSKSLHSFLHLRDHCSFINLPTHPLYTHSSLHLDLQALLKQLLKTPLTSYSYSPVFHPNLHETWSCKSLQPMPLVFCTAVRPGCHREYTESKHTLGSQRLLITPASIAKPVCPHSWAWIQCDVLSAFQHL